MFYRSGYPSKCMSLQIPRSRANGLSHRKLDHKKVVRSVDVMVIVSSSTVFLGNTIYPFTSELSIREKIKPSLHLYNSNSYDG